MPISLRSSSSWTVLSTYASSYPASIPAHEAGDLILVRAAGKPWGAWLSTSSAGWGVLRNYRDGFVFQGDGVGSLVAGVIWKIATSSSETLSFSWNWTPGPMAYSVLVYRKDPGEIWQPPIGWGGPGAANTSFSATTVFHHEAMAGDVLDFFVALRDDTTFSSRPVISQSGLTIGSATYAPSSGVSTTTANDMTADGGYSPVTSGTSTAAAVVSATLGTAESGLVWVTRLRVANVMSPVGRIAIGAVGYSSPLAEEHAIGIKARIRQGGPSGLIGMALYQGSTNVSGDLYVEVPSTYTERRVRIPDSVVSQIQSYASGLELRFWVVGLIGWIFDISWIKLWAPWKSRAISVNAAFLKAASGSFGVVAFIPGDVYWTSPAGDGPISGVGTLGFRMPNPILPNKVHFEIQFATDEAFTDPIIVRSYPDPTGWEYWDGDEWLPFPSGGIPSAFASYDARYAVQTPLEGTYYRRIRAGMI